MEVPPPGLLSLSICTPGSRPSSISVTFEVGIEVISEGFIPAKIYKQLNVLEEQTGQKAIQWSEREKLLAILN